MKSPKTLSQSLSDVAATQPADDSEFILLPASSDMTDTKIATIENTPPFKDAFDALVKAINLHKTARESGDFSPEILQQLKDAKAMADAARINEWNGFSRFQKQVATFGRGKTFSDMWEHFKDEALSKGLVAEYTNASLFTLFDNDYPLWNVFYQTSIGMDPILCSPNKTKNVPPSP